ncbi:MAG: hypothetical protein Kow002_17060 [Anaerolineales bacterium]
MADRKFNLHDGKKGAALAVRVSPRARNTEIVGALNDGTVKVRLTASGDDEQANKELVGFLADILNVAPSRIEIVAGATGRDKLISVIDMDSETLHKTIVANM